MKKRIVITKPNEVIRLQQNGAGTAQDDEYTVVLAQSGASVQVRGVFDAEKKAAITQKIIIHHQAPNTRAEVTLKGVGRDESFITFEGRIIIDEDCGNSHSFLTERILLLSPQARAEAIPDLEIHTDDVSCSHAASVSNIPESQLFYLMSRGLKREMAEDLIVAGFLE